MRKGVKELLCSNNGESFWNKTDNIVIVPVHLEDYVKSYGKTTYGKIFM
jgi:hypothetical protein